MEVCDVALEEGALLVNPIEPDSSCSLDPESELARATAVDADNLGSDAKVVEVRRLGTSRVDVLSRAGVDFLAARDEQLAVGPDMGRAYGYAGDGDGVYASLGPLCRGTLEDMGEQGGDVGTARCDGDTLHQARKQDCAPGKRDDGQTRSLVSRHGDFSSGSRNGGRHRLGKGRFDWVRMMARGRTRSDVAFASKGGALPCHVTSSMTKVFATGR